MSARAHRERPQLTRRKESRRNTMRNGTEPATAMNTLWMSSDFERIPALMSGARGAFFAGLACIAAAAATSTNLRDTFSHFKRFRVLKG